ncbi:MAG: hypothetical protein KY475_01460 [Planctomycetes bacterium]|nr:hypothetical protein [Planctomycetota bacterium]
MRYLDTGRRNPQSFLGSWLQKYLAPEIRSFEAQFGYFEFGGLRPFATSLRSAAENGASVHPVLGSNHRHLAESSLIEVLAVIGGIRDASVTVVAFSNALFHPKVGLVEKANGHSACLIGSGNLTAAGISRNVEALLTLDTEEDVCGDIVAEVREAIAYWRSLPSPDGAFPIRKNSDIPALVKRRILCTDGEYKARLESQRNAAGAELPILGDGWASEPDRIPASHDQRAAADAVLEYSAARQAKQRSKHGENRCFDLVGQAIVAIDPGRPQTRKEIIASAKQIGEHKDRDTSNMYNTYYDFVNKKLIDKLGAVRRDHADGERRRYRLANAAEFAAQSRE